MFGIPEIVKSYNGLPFRYNEFIKFAEELNFKHRKITRLWPQVNGCDGPFMKAPKKSIQNLAAKGLDWKENLSLFLLNWWSCRTIRSCCWYYRFCCCYCCYIFSSPDYLRLFTFSPSGSGSFKDVLDADEPECFYPSFKENVEIARARTAVKARATERSATLRRLKAAVTRLTLLCSRGGNPCDDPSSEEEDRILRNAVFVFD